MARKVPLKFLENTWLKIEKEHFSNPRLFLKNSGGD